MYLQCVCVCGGDKYLSAETPAADSEAVHFTSYFHVRAFRTRFLFHKTHAFNLSESNQQRHVIVACLWKLNFNNVHTSAVNFHTNPAVLFSCIQMSSTLQHTAGELRNWRDLCLFTDYCSTVKIRVKYYWHAPKFSLEQHCQIKKVFNIIQCKGHDIKQIPINIAFFVLWWNKFSDLLLK